jgi:hypothetical protein
MSAKKSSRLDEEPYGYDQKKKPTDGVMFAAVIAAVGTLIGAIFAAFDGDWTVVLYALGASVAYAWVALERRER